MSSYIHDSFWFQTSPSDSINFKVPYRGRFLGRSLYYGMIGFTLNFAKIYLSILFTENDFLELLT